MNAHAKRFILVSAFLVGEIISFITSEVMVAAAVGGAAAIVAVKYNHDEMNQMQGIGDENTNTIAIQHDGDAQPTTVTIPMPPPPATPTSDGLITIETMGADSAEHKTGDVVFHIPEESRARMQDILNMIGLDAVAKTCQGQDVLSAKPNSRIRKREGYNDCVRSIEHFATDFASSAPPDLLQLAPKNFPMPPVVGQDIGFPLFGLKIDGMPAIIPTYRYLRSNIPKTGALSPPSPGTFDPKAVHLPSLVLSSFALTVVTNAIATGGKVAADIWVAVANLARVKTEELFCPENILCVEDDCGAQKTDRFIRQDQAICVKVRPTRITLACVLMHFTGPYRRLSL
jgi:hypothetical protein